MQSNQLVNFANEFDFMPNLVLITIAKKRHSGAIYEAMKTEHSVTPALDNVAYSPLSHHQLSHSQLLFGVSRKFV